ncbi:hypothetical protein M8181_09695 [Bacillus licheniformis]|nr:hypothetical protein LXN06_09730 [Bacillus licheniformis]WIY58273.1 hypothetical protein M8181_09695 [Bacillus licheniformis]
MDKYDHFKLKIDAKPSLFHKQTVRKAVGRSVVGENQKRGSTEPRILVCGYQPHIDQTHRLHVHEKEEYDFKK